MSDQFVDIKIAIVGLGYVGLPLAVTFGHQFPTKGYDIQTRRIDDLKQHIDSTLECSRAELRNTALLSFTDNLHDIADCNVYIITVPTPINAHKQPNFTPLISASQAIGHLLKQGDTVIYESTVYPGATEEVCVPILEQLSSLSLNKDFTVGYSPERINPGDKSRPITSLQKVTSGSTPEAAEFIDALYASVITAGTHKVSSIKVAEAAKVIENTQRDVNIALINELAVIFNKLDIDTEEVLEAAGTKWNFLPFRPGLVGGHCIGVDPYYLTHKAQSIGHHPEIIMAGRRINDNMSHFVCAQLVKAMLKKSVQVQGANVLIMGLSFKENCPDLRNTRVVDIVEELSEYNMNIDIVDPWVSQQDARDTYGLDVYKEIPTKQYDVILLAVAHNQFKQLTKVDLARLSKANSVIYDLKYVLDKDVVDLRL